jgi:replication-associated recombination protein RarA
VLHKTITANGYHLDAVSSAFQKNCRRGNVYEACFFAAEMLRSDLGGYLWRRLLVIASEDVGPGSNETAVVVQALYQSALVLTRKRTPTGEDWRAGGLQALHAVAAICRAPKSRMIADLSSVISFRVADGERLPIPDFALDMHTHDGRRAGIRRGTVAGRAHWREHGRIVHPDAGIGHEWRATFDGLWDQHDERKRGGNLALDLSDDDADADGED